MFKQLTVFLLCIVQVFSQSISAAANQNSKSKPWIEWDSTEGINRLQTSETKENYWKLLRYFETQSRLAYCSVASTVMVLNALGVESPPTQYLGTYQLHTQDNFFSEEVCTLVDRDDVEVVGVSLYDLAEIFPAFPVKIQVFEAMNMNHSEMRNILIKALKNRDQYVLALYHRKPLEQEGMAHWSPIAAYDVASDSFLILDVARYKYPPVWADSIAFFNAMQTCNGKGKSRGFIIVEAKK